MDDFFPPDFRRGAEEFALAGVPVVGVQEEDRFAEPARGKHGEVPDDGGGAFAGLGSDELDHFPRGGFQEGVDVPRKGNHRSFLGEPDFAAGPFPGGKYDDHRGTFQPLPLPFRLLQRFEDFSHDVSRRSSRKVYSSIVGKTIFLPGSIWLISLIPRFCRMTRSSTSRLL